MTSVDENCTNNIASSARTTTRPCPNAKSAAEALQQQFPAIQRVEPKFSPLPAGPVVVVLAADWPTS